MRRVLLASLLLLGALACGGSGGGGFPDVGLPDAAPTDAARPDTGPPDVGAPDATPADTGTDASPEDAGLPPADAGEDAGDDASPEDAGAGPLTTVRIHYDSGFGNRIGIRGEAPLDWDATTATTWTEGNVWVWTTRALEAPAELKPVFVDGADVVTWPEGPNWIVTPGATLDIYPFFFADGGTLTSFDVSSAALGGTRTVEVYLPPSYGEEGASGRSYPLLVMQDGQNLFDPFAIGGGWAVDDSLDALLVRGGAPASDGERAAGGVREMIVVAPHHAGVDRIYEYTPTDGDSRCTAPGDCGGADGYLDFVVDELLPEVRSRYRVAEGKVGIAGSSLGGLVSLHACWTRPETFDHCGVFSPSLWWDSQWILGQVVTDTGPRRDLRIYVDAGTSSDGLPNVVALTDDLTTKPVDLRYTLGDDLLCLEGEGHGHDEAAWRARAPWALEWLYEDADRVQPTPDRPSDVVLCAP